MNRAVVKFAAASVAAVAVFAVLIDFSNRRDEKSTAAAVRAANAEFVKVHAPFFSMKPAQREKLLANASTLCVGDPVETVVAVLGKPSQDGTWSSKRIPAGPPIRELSYYITIYENGLVNEIHDEYVAVYLEHDRIRKIYRKLK
jgi:hypothetical protein